MTTRIRTPENQNHAAIAVASLDTARGMRVAFDETSSSSTAALSDGVYLVSLSANAYVRIAADGAAGDLAGSFLMAAGSSGFFAVKAGHRIHARGIDGAGALFAIPLENA